MSIRVEEGNLVLRLWPDQLRADAVAKALGEDWKSVLHYSELGWLVKNSNGERRDVAGKID